MAESLRQLRSNRTRASNSVHRQIKWMLREPAKWAIGGQLVEHDPTFQGLPSWWPFWSDSLKSNTRDVVRAARALAMEEGNPILGWAITDEDDQLNWKRIRS